MAYAVHPLLPGDRIDLEALRPKLATWGLHPSRNRRWTKAQAHAHDEAGMLFVKPSSATSRAIVLLEVSGQPKSTAELTGVSDSRSINNMLRLEPRVSRTTHNLLALTKWNLPRRDPHTVRNIQQALRKNGPMTLEALKDLMAAHHGALPNTVKSAVSVPAFVQEGDTIRLRQFSEMPYVIPKPNGPVPTKSTFILGPGHVAKLHKLTQPHIKGSSIQAGKTVAAVLELPTETVTQFRDEDGNPVRISFSSTSMSGPTIHSLRPILRAKQARQGDHILITFHRDSLKATLDVIDVTNPPTRLAGRRPAHRPRWQRQHQDAGKRPPVPARKHPAHPRQAQRYRGHGPPAHSRRAVEPHKRRSRKKRKGSPSHRPGQAALAGFPAARPAPELPSKKGGRKARSRTGTNLQLKCRRKAHGRNKNTHP